MTDNEFKNIYVGNAGPLLFKNVLQSLCLTAHPGVTEALGVIEAYPGV
jgi:hypothetical protein